MRGGLEDTARQGLGWGRPELPVREAEAVSGKRHPKECPGMGGRASSPLPPASWIYLGTLCCVAPPCCPLPLRSERVLGKSGPGGLGSGKASGKTVGALSPSLPPMRALQSLFHTPHTCPDWG